MQTRGSEGQKERERNGMGEREREREAVATFLFSVALHKTRAGTSAHPMEVVADWLWCNENILKAEHLQIKQQAEKHFHDIIGVMFHWSCLISLFSAPCLSWGDKGHLGILGRCALVLPFVRREEQRLACWKPWWVTWRWGSWRSHLQEKGVLRWERGATIGERGRCKKKMRRQRSGADVALGGVDFFPLWPGVMEGWLAFINPL